LLYCFFTEIRKTVPPYFRPQDATQRVLGISPPCCLSSRDRFFIQSYVPEGAKLDLSSVVLLL
jgi:hypothetical protein